MRLSFPNLLSFCALSLCVIGAFAQQEARNSGFPDFQAAAMNARNRSTVISIQDEIYGRRNVSYFIVGEHAVIDGDVVYGTVERLRSKAIRGNGPRSHENRAFIVSPDNGGKPWPGGVITYRYESDAAEAAVKSIVDTAISRWLAVAPWLTFTRLTPNNAVGNNGMVTIRNPSCGGCSAHVGYWAGFPTVLNLQSQCGSSSGACHAGSAAHELGHTLGLAHEHQRPDRASYVNLLCQNVNPSCPAGTTMPPGTNCCSTSPPTGCCTGLLSFNPITSGFQYGGPYDSRSIMHYSPGAFAISGTQVLTPAAPGVVIQDGSSSGGPTTLDGDGLCRLYKTVCPRAVACIAANCPATCTIVGQCNIAACSGSSPPPCCNAAAANAACMAHRSTCQPLNCAFLTN